MKYLVMECHKAYAVVLDEEGHFLITANLNYEVGQKVSSVTEMELPDHDSEKLSLNFFSYKKLSVLASLAACLCLIFFGSWQYFFSSFGTVKMQINPSILISANRIGYVICLEGENDDGKMLIDGYDFHLKKLDTVVTELADNAVLQGYLKEGGEIHLTLSAKKQTWAENTEKRLLTLLTEQFENTVSVTTEFSMEKIQKPKDNAEEVFTDKNNTCEEKNTRKPDEIAEPDDDISKPVQDADADDDADTNDNSGSDDDADTDNDSEPDPDTDTGDDPGSDPDTDTGDDPGSDDDADTDDDSEPDPDTDTDDDADPDHIEDDPTGNDAEDELSDEEISEDDTSE